MSRRPSHGPAFESANDPGSPPPSRRGGPKRGGGSSGGGGVWLFGLHAVKAALANPERRPRRLLLTEECGKDWDGGGPQPEFAGRKDIEKFLPPGATHQGCALLCDPLAPADLEDVLEGAPEDALILILDQVTDPHNVGAILRSAAAFGALAVVAQDRHAAPATGTLAKAASGALEILPLVHVTNLSRAIVRLKQDDFWCVGLDSAGPAPLSAALRPGKTALVLGAEGAGLRRLVAEHCDALARLPTDPDFPSLNVSNAAAVALYAVRAAAKA